MMKPLFVSLILFLCNSLIQAESVSITGIVKKTGATTGLAGVNVALTMKSTLSATTDTDGKFNLNESTAIRQINPEKIPPIRFNLHKNCIVFSPISRNAAGIMDIFSSNGKRIFSMTISLDKTGTQSIVLPSLNSGINLMRLTVGGKSISRTLVCMGDELFMEKGLVNEQSTGMVSLLKRASAAVVDTLVVSKTGFTTKKITLDSYTKDNMIIELDSAGTGRCTRESLKAIVDTYIEAQTAGDPTMMPLAEEVKVSVNATDTSIEKSILKQPLAIDFHLSIYDVDSCRTFTEVIVANSSPAYVMGTRLRIKDDTITEISMIVTKEGDWLFNAADYLKYAKQQNWYILPENERSTREKLIDAGDQYLDIFNGDFEGLPWGAPCYRIEGGAVTFQGDTTADYCKVKEGDLMAGNPFLIGERDFIVDVDLGTSNVYCAFCKLDSHMFRLVNGHYRYVHTLTVGCN